MFGHFSPEALKAFAEAHNLDTGNQDFSEGLFDFKVCKKPSGERFGISDDEKCAPPNKEVGAPLNLGPFNRKERFEHEQAQNQAVSRNERVAARKEGERMRAFLAKGGTREQWDEKVWRENLNKPSSGSQGGGSNALGRAVMERRQQQARAVNKLFGN